MAKQRVLYLLAEYPQISQTYIKVEIERLSLNYDLSIISTQGANYPYEQSFPHKIIEDLDEMIECAKAFSPDFIHTHWLHKHLPKVFKVAKALKVPFTIRAHSFDTLWPDEPWYKRIKRKSRWAQVKKYRKIVNHDLCRGVLAFPFVIDKMVKAGFDRNKVITAYPPLDYTLFYNRDKNGDGIINVGACIPKKKFEDYIELATLIPEKEFHLFSLGYLTEDIRQKNNNKGSPVNLHEPISHEQMPAKLKEMQWMVYTADADIAAVGWPLALVEAQAAGVGVCMHRVRPDLEEYMNGSAVLYDSIDELTELLKGDVPEELREKGFENAKRFDIDGHLHQLTHLWDR